MLVQRWTSKPWPGVGIDWTHPLTRGLVGCWIFNEGSGGIVHNYGLSGDANNGVLTTTSGTLPTWVGSPSGGGLSTATSGGNGSYVDCGNISGFASATNASLFAMGRLATTPILWVFGVGTDTSNRLQIELWSDGVFYLSTNSEYPTCSNPSGDFSVGATFDGSQVAASRVQAYINGVRQTLTGTISSTALGATTSTINLSRFEAAYSDGRFDAAMMWAGRTLTAQDIQDLHTNPWQIFQPNTSYFLFKPGVESDTGSATITAAATIAATGLVTAASGVVGVTAASTVVATGLVTAATGVAGVTASATIAATGLATYTGSAGITATGTIAATGLVTAATGVAGVTASATIAATGTAAGPFTGSAGVTAAATIEATGLATYTGSAGVTATGTISATGLVTAATGIAGVTASATIEASGTVSGVVTGSGEIDATATIAATGLVTAATGVAGITATGTISATGGVTASFTGSAGITASSTIAATGLVTAATGVAGITATGTIAATGLVTAASGIAGITATSTISAIGISSSAVVLPIIYPDPFAAALLTTYTPFSAELSTTTTPFGATSVIGLVTGPRPCYAGSAGITASGTIEATGLVSYELFMLLGLI